MRGIGAARDWIFAQLSGYAAASGGMTVELQSYVQEPASRIPTATRITNMVATLRGDSAPNRVYVVTGHYDSRATDVMDAVSDAPGADDDASGVAVLMELARVMASRRSEATIVFAAQLKAAGVDVQGMFSAPGGGPGRAPQPGGLPEAGQLTAGSSVPGGVASPDGGAAWGDRGRAAGRRPRRRTPERSMA
ncbi:M28 family peptidase [Micromonospora sp. NBC_00898]|uniref:M28 family peptidase n=1 Tax=Micromonospora sp. NBC_00898 TaxID=2975981 RepID=UPI00386F7B01|nr:M28 family peptidase [Micromonospora sp. NBC_00898]